MGCRICSPFAQSHQLSNVLKFALASSRAAYYLHRKGVGKLIGFFISLIRSCVFLQPVGPASTAVKGACSRMPHSSFVVGEAYLVKMTRKIGSLSGFVCFCQKRTRCWLCARRRRGLGRWPDPEPLRLFATCIAQSVRTVCSWPVLVGSGGGTEDASPTLVLFFCSPWRHMSWLGRYFIYFFFLLAKLFRYVCYAGSFIFGCI